jgi:hypothetical protein
MDADTTIFSLTSEAGREEQQWNGTTTLETATLKLEGALLPPKHQ